MVISKFNYRGKSVYRKNQIVNWFLEDVNKRDMKYSLQIYLDTGIINRFENVLENHPESFFSYIVEEGQSEEFALRVIRKLGLKKTPIKTGGDLPPRKYGTIKEKRVIIKSFDKITLPNNKIIIRARDYKGRFVKL